MREALAARIRDEFLPKAALQPDRVSGIAAITADAITYKVLASPLTDAELATLIQIPPTAPEPRWAIARTNGGCRDENDAMSCARPRARLALAAHAQYPTKPVRLVLPYSPGGIIDYVGRTLATHMSGPLGQQVVAENRPGGGGIAGTDTVARSAPDGYTIVIMDPAIVINPTLQPSMPYDLFKQLATVSIVSSSPEVLVVAPQLPVRPSRS